MPCYRIRRNRFLQCSRWFIEAYIGLYILAPMINRFIEKSTHRELGIFILAFYLFSTLFGYLGKAYDFNKGMSIISLVGLYLIGAYLRRKQDGIFDLSKYVYLGVYLVTGFIIAVSSFAVYLIHNDLSIKPLYCATCDYIEAHYTPSFPYALLFMVGVFIVSVMADKVRLFIYRHTLLRLLE